MYYIVYIIDYIKYLYLCYYIFIYDIILNTSGSAQTERNLLQGATKYDFIFEKQALKESSGMSLV